MLLKILRKGLSGVVLLSICASQAHAASAPLCMNGVNLSGAEYGDRNGVYGTNYTYPSDKTVHYFARKGFDTVRLTFLWDRLQPVLSNPLDPVELQRLKDAVAQLQGQGFKVILDPHNFGYYGGKRMATDDVPNFAFADFWTRTAAEFANVDGVAFGLMNEPHDIPSDLWLDAANSALAGIRGVGAKNLVLVPGTNWSGASSWFDDFPGGANADMMLKVNDPDGNFVYEFHQYMDKDFSGTHETCPRAADAVAALTKVSQWLKDNKRRAVLGEFGGSKDPACLAGIKAMANTLRSHSNQWLGFTYWAAGDWWPESEGNNIQPTTRGDRPQLKAIGISAQKNSKNKAQCAANPQD